MKFLTKTILISLFIIFMWFYCLNVFVNVKMISAINQDLNNTIENSPGVEIINIGDVVSTSVTRHKWYGSYNIISSEKVSYGYINLLGFKIIVDINNFDFMFLHILLVFSLLMLGIFIYYSQLNKGGLK